MANFKVRDAVGTIVELKATGTGTTGDPFLPDHGMTDAQLRAAPVPVSGIVVVQAVSGTALSTTSINGKNRLDVTLAGGGMVGSTAPTFGDLVMGSDGTNSRALATDTAGKLQTYSPNAEVLLTGTFNRPANVTAYAAGQLVANSTTAGSVVPIPLANAVRIAGDCVRIEKVRLSKTGTSLTNAAFRIYFFEASPTFTAGDGAAFNASGVLACNQVLRLAGNVALTMTNSGSDGATGNGVPTVGNSITSTPVSGTTLYACIEATAAYTPVSGETFTLLVEGYRA